MRQIDELHLQYPFAGSRMLRGLLWQQGLEAGRRHIKTLMRRMSVEAIYRRPNTSKPAPGHRIYPYLLRGLAVVVMEPLMGGRLADPPKDVLEAMEGFPLRRSPVEWALQWLWDQPEVSVVLSGMSSMSQVEENLSSADRSGVRSFSPAEQALIAEVKEKYSARIAIPCSKCNYCMPCPNGLHIPANFEFYNYAHLYDNVADAKFRYGLFLKEEQRASACIACGICEEMCPQGIAISEEMAKVAALLG